MNELLDVIQVFGLQAIEHNTCNRTIVSLKKTVEIGKAKGKCERVTWPLQNKQIFLENSLHKLRARFTQVNI